jgi:hypothetical protein
MHCEERSRLSADVRKVLQKVVHLTQEEMRTFERDLPKFHEVDRELEHAIGEKERLIGALRQHENDHGCA